MSHIESGFISPPKAEEDNLTEYKIENLRELDVFVQSIALVLSDQPDIQHSNVGHRTLLGTLKGDDKASTILKQQARKHGFHGQLKNIVLIPEEVDREILPKGLRDIENSRVQTLGISAEMHSSGRGFIGYERLLATLYVPREGFFKKRYSTQGTLLNYYQEQGEPMVLLAGRSVRGGETIKAVEMLRVGSEQIRVWIERFALARTMSSAYEMKPVDKKISYHGAH